MVAGILSTVSGFAVVNLKGVAAIYNRYEYIAERKAVTEDWGQLVEETASGKPVPSNVIKIHQAAR